MKCKLIIGLLLLSSQVLLSQNVIRGKVTDQNNLPLVGASILLPEIYKGTISGADGEYELPDLPNGNIKLQFSYVGFASKVESIVLNGQPVELNVELKESVVEAEEIVVTGGYNTSQHQNTVKIDVLKLSSTELKATPNFMEMLTKIPGVDMISKGSGISKPVIRGLSMNDILVLNNGVRFENYQYSSHHPLGIDEFGISDVEVIKGPASLLYGSDAIGGVVNFIREKPAEAGTVSGDYNLQLFSNSLGMTNNFGIKGAGKNFYGGIRAGQKTNADYLQGGGAYVPNSRFNEYSLKTIIGSSNRIGSFSLYYDYSQQNLGLIEPEALALINQRGRYELLYYQQFQTHLISGRNKIYLGRTKMDLNTSYQNTQLIHIGDPGIYELQMNLGTFCYETKVYLPSDKYSEYIVGFQGIKQLNRNTHDRETILLPNADINNYSGFALLQKTFFEKLKLQTGVRYDNKSLQTYAYSFPDSASYRAPLNRNYSSFSGSIGTTFSASDQLLFRGNIAAAYRTPNLAELTSNGPHEGRYESGNSSLVPENSYEADLSTHFHRQNFTIDIAGFYNIIRDYLFIAPTGSLTTGGLPVYKYMQRNSLLFGGEAGLHIHPEFIKWMHFQTTFSSVTGKQDNGDYLPFVPAGKLNFEWIAEKEKMGNISKASISANLGIAFKQDKAAPDETPTAGYSLLDLSAGGFIKVKNQSVYIALSVNNIFDVKYVDHLSTLKEVNLFNPGRNFALTLRLPFDFKPGSPSLKLR
ncbi:MAG: TonB-dependent receptor [Bacteroidales bacterium]|nr:TonB-dependent receptor [Bacteroidales bacterium]